VADFWRRCGESRYVAGALPSLPFADAAFDLVLTANFLMVYAPLQDGGMSQGTDFGLEFHLKAVEELARVTKDELRISGMHTWKQPPERHPYCQPLMNRLEVLGMRPVLVQSHYDDGCSITNPACNQVLVARRR
jgi:hypothetical protein